MKRAVLAGSAVLLLLTGCERRHSEAVVLEKEHIAIRSPTPPHTPTPTLSETELTPESELREIAPDETYTDRARYEKLSPGDRVNVAYRLGKFSGTIWSVDLE